MSGDDIFGFLVAIGAVAVAYGLAYWVFRAVRDRSALVGLYLLFGIPGVLVVVVGSAFALRGSERGWAALAVGLGLCLPLIPSVRRFFAAWTPLDERSPVDMAGLCVVLSVGGLLGMSYVLSPGPADSGGDVTVAALLVQFLAEIAFAYVLVGTTITRTFKQASARLGLVRPRFGMVMAAAGLVVVGYVFVALGGILTTVLQPDVSRTIEEITDEITSDVQNPLGAVFFGVGAGAGEELLLRGAIQPRIGLLPTSILFGLLHTQYGVSFILLGIFFVGLMLGLERKYLGTTAAIITHAIFNAIAVLAGQG